VAGSPRSDDDKAGTPLAGLSCSCWVLHKPIEKSSAWGQKTPYYNRPTQDGLRGHFVLRAIGKRFRKDHTAGCEKVVGIRFALDSSLEGDGFEPSVPLETLAPGPRRPGLPSAPPRPANVREGTCRLHAHFPKSRAPTGPGGVERGPLRGTGDFPGIAMTLV
jgi:hypothetical protein